MMDVVAFCNPIQGSNKQGSIICDDLLESTPAAQNFIEYKLSYCPTSLMGQSLPFWPSSQRIPCLYDIFMPLGQWHIHCVDVCFLKK